MITINHESCSGCGRCVKECAFGLIEIKDNQALISRDGCVSCGHCSAVCPECAITVINSRYKIAASLAIGYPAVDYLRTVPRKPAKVDWR